MTKNHTPIEFGIDLGTIQSISFDEHSLPTFTFQKGSNLIFEVCTFRLEKSGEYLMGYLDDNGLEKEVLKLEVLIGKKLLQIDKSNMFIDTRFSFEDNYTLKTFSCVKYPVQWRLISGNDEIYKATIDVNTK